MFLYVSFKSLHRLKVVACALYRFCALLSHGGYMGFIWVFRHIMYKSMRKLIDNVQLLVESLEQPM